MPAELGSPAHRLDLLYKLSVELSSTLNLDDVLGKVLSMTVSSLGANKGSIFLLDDQGRVTRKILARADLIPEDSRHVVATVMDTGLAGWVLRHGTPAVITDTQEDERWVTFPDDVTTPRSALSVPLMRGKRVVGLLTLVHPEPGCFSPLDLGLAVAIAGLAAVAVENARLFSQVNLERRTLAAVLRSVRAAILVTTFDRRILLINPPAAAILQINHDEAVDKPLPLVIDLPSLLQLFERSNPTMAAPISGEVRLPDGSTYNATLSPVPEVGYAAVLHDITFLKRLDELKTESLAAVSHDLRGPLGTILGSAEMMVRYTEVGDEQKEYIDLITGTADRMRALVERLLDLSRIESGQALEWQVVAMQPVLTDIVREARVQARLKEVQLTADYAPDLPPVRVDPVHIGQAVANLLHNAIKYTPSGGWVNLSARADSQRQTMLIRVADTGPGIPPEAKQRLFTKFYRVGSMHTMEHEGVGLGLAIVRSVVQAHQGQVWVDSEWGQGAAFTISLPLDSLHSAPGY